MLLCLAVYDCPGNSGMAQAVGCVVLESPHCQSIILIQWCSLRAACRQLSSTAWFKDTVHF